MKVSKNIADRSLYNGLFIYTKSKEAFGYFSYYAYKNGEKVAYMLAKPVTNKRHLKRYYSPDDLKPSFLICNLISYNHNKGYASRLLDFAEQESRRMGCKGRIHLESSGVFNPYKQPHIFYRKNGFGAFKKYYNFILDKKIKYNQILNLKNLKGIKMTRNPNSKKDVLKKVVKLKEMGSNKNFSVLDRLLKIIIK